MDFGYDSGDFYIFPDFNFGTLSAEESLPPLPEYTDNKLILSTGLPESVITPIVSVTKEFQIGAGLPLVLTNLLAPAEDSNCDKLPSVDYFDGLERSSSDTRESDFISDLCIFVSCFFLLQCNIGELMNNYNATLSVIQLGSITLNCDPMKVAITLPSRNRDVRCITAGYLRAFVSLLNYL